MITIYLQVAYFKNYILTICFLYFKCLTLYLPNEYDFYLYLAFYYPKYNFFSHNTQNY